MIFWHYKFSNRKKIVYLEKKVLFLVEFQYLDNYVLLFKISLHKTEKTC